MGARQSTFPPWEVLALPRQVCPYAIRVLDLDGFVQDNFKVNSHLTVNLGLRWEYDGLPNVTNGDFSNYLPRLAAKGALPITPAAGTLAGFIVPSNYPGSLVDGLTRNSNSGAIPRHMPYDDFAPRLGFAWQPTASNRWVVRAGVGYFYDLIGGQIFADNNPGATAPVRFLRPLHQLRQRWLIYGFSHQS